MNLQMWMLMSVNTATKLKKNIKLTIKTVLTQRSTSCFVPLFRPFCFVTFTSSSHLSDSTPSPSKEASSRIWPLTTSVLRTNTNYSLPVSLSCSYLSYLFLPLYVSLSLSICCYFSFIYLFLLHLSFSPSLCIILSLHLPFSVPVSLYQSLSPASSATSSMIIVIFIATWNSKAVSYIR